MPAQLPIGKNVLPMGAHVEVDFKGQRGGRFVRTVVISDRPKHKAVFSPLPRRQHRGRNRTWQAPLSSTARWSRRWNLPLTNGPAKGAGRALMTSTLIGGSARSRRTSITAWSAGNGNGPRAMPLRNRRRLASSDKSGRSIRSSKTQLYRPSRLIRWSSTKKLSLGEARKRITDGAIERAQALLLVESQGRMRPTRLVLVGQSRSRGRSRCQQ